MTVHRLRPYPLPLLETGPSFPVFLRLASVMNVKTLHKQHVKGGRGMDNSQGGGGHFGNHHHHQQQGPHQGKGRGRGKGKGGRGGGGGGMYRGGNQVRTTAYWRLGPSPRAYVETYYQYVEDDYVDYLS